jgi:hypothetical protein
MNLLTHPRILIGSLGVGIIAARTGVFGHHEINIDIDKYEAIIRLKSGMFLDHVRITLNDRDLKSEKSFKLDMPVPAQLGYCAQNDYNIYTGWSLRPIKVSSVGKNHLVDETMNCISCRDYVIRYCL